MLLGGASENVFKRIVRWGDGWLPIRVSPDDVRGARAALSELSEAAGRDSESISITVYGQEPDRDLIKRFEEAGANSVIVRVTAPDQAGVLSELEGMAGNVLN